MTALGGTAILALTDHDGRFELPGLTAGSYVVTARLKGYVAPPAQQVEIGSGARRISTLVLRRARTSVPLLAAGIGAGEPDPPAVADPASDGSSVDPPAAGDETPETDADHGETAWRLRHARRSVLKNVALPDDLLADDGPADTWPGGVVSRAVDRRRVSRPVSLPITPFSGQVNFLTTGSLKHRKELFSSDSLAHGIAYVRLARRSARTVTGDCAAHSPRPTSRPGFWQDQCATRAPAQHNYDVGWSYSTQRYDGGNVLTRRDLAEGSRNVGTMYGFDTFTIAPALTVSYGSRYARYRLPRGPKPRQSASRGDGDAR